MTPETGYFLVKAREQLDQAEAIFAIKLYDGWSHGLLRRLSCRAGAHLPSHQSLGQNPSGRERGAASAGPERCRFDEELRAFLGRGYQLKAIADYETGPDSHVTPEQAQAAITGARRFLAIVDGPP